MFVIYAGVDARENHAHMPNTSHFASNSSADLASMMMSMSTLGLFVSQQAEALQGQVPIPTGAS